jgi:hypothetical protein
MKSQKAHRFRGQKAKPSNRRRAERHKKKIPVAVKAMEARSVDAFRMESSGSTSRNATASVAFSPAMATRWTCIQNQVRT